MLKIECPSCRATCEAGPEFAGKSVVCPKCGKTAAVPRDAGAITGTPPLLLPALTAVTTPDVVDAQEARTDAASWPTQTIAGETARSSATAVRCGHGCGPAFTPRSASVS